MDSKVDKQEIFRRLETEKEPVSGLNRLQTWVARRGFVTKLPVGLRSELVSPKQKVSLGALVEYRRSRIPYTGLPTETQVFKIWLSPDSGVRSLGAFEGVDLLSASLPIPQLLLGKKVGESVLYFNAVGECFNIEILSIA